MRSASLKDPQSRLTAIGAPSTFSPVVGICDWLSAAHAGRPNAPTKANVIVVCFRNRFIFVLPPKEHLQFVLFAVSPPPRRQKPVRHSGESRNPLLHQADFQ